MAFQHFFARIRTISCEFIRIRTKKAQPTSVVFFSRKNQIRAKMIKIIIFNNFYYFLIILSFLHKSHEFVRNCTFFRTNSCEFIDFFEYNVLFIQNVHISKFFKFFSIFGFSAIDNLGKMSILPTDLFSIFF